jgi:hypothetical protein
MNAGSLQNEAVRWVVEDWFESKCECGAESIGMNTHSHWCGKASAA